MSSSTQYTLRLISYLFLCLCLAYTAGFGAHRVWDEVEQVSQTQPLGVFWEAWDLLEQNFYGELSSPRERTYGAIRGALALLNDPYTVFVEPQPRELERDRMRGAFGGIGVTVWRDAQSHMVLTPHPASPADARGRSRSAVDLSALARAAGAAQVSVVDIDRGEDIRAATESGMRFDGVSVVFARGRCPRCPERAS